MNRKGEGDGRDQISFMSPKKQRKGMSRRASLGSTDPLTVCQFIESREHKAFCASHPEVKAVVDAMAPEYLALRERAATALLNVLLPNAAKIPHMPTKIPSTNVIFALRQWLMRNETLTEAEAESMVRTEVLPGNEWVVKKATAALLDTATALTKLIQNSPQPREAFVFLLMREQRIVLMELGCFASARRRCAACAAPGIRRCSKCGLAWYCTTECQVAHWSPATSASASTDVKSAAPEVKAPVGPEVKAAGMPDVKAPPLPDIKSASTAHETKSTATAATVHSRPSHRLTCRGPPIDRSVFRAAQRLLSEGFRPMENVLDWSDSTYALFMRLPEENSDKTARTALYEAAHLDLAAKSVAAAEIKSAGTSRCK
jgi:hypothetical protein